MPTPTLKSYQKIAQQYADYNTRDSKSENTGISSWKYFFTDVFYQGTHSSYAVRDWLAGGVKNNFLFELLPKSDHAEFISVINRICQIGHDQETLQKIGDISSEDKDFGDNIGGLFTDYFLIIQEKYHKNPSTPNQIILRELKKDINNFLQYHKIKTRIKKEGDSYEIEKNLGENYYEQDRHYQDKKNNRKIKTSNKRWAKCLGFLAGAAEIFINFMGIWMIGGLVTAHIPIIAPLIIPLAIFGACSGFHSGFNLFSENIYKNLKEIRRGRFFKDKDGKKLPKSKKITITLFSVFACAAGFCAFALTTYSVSTIFSITMIAALPITIPFALPLAVGLMFMYIDNIRGCILDFNERYEYFKNDYWPNVTRGKLAKDVCKLVFAFTLTAAISIIGFALYLTKGTFILAGVAAKTIIASIFSGINSLVKLIFGTNKVRQLIDHTHIASASSDAPTPLQKEIERIEKYRQRILSATAFGNGASKGGLYAYTASTTLGLTGALAFIAGIMEAIYIAAPWLVLRESGRGSFFPDGEEKSSPDKTLSCAFSRGSP
jgi:hypothetical protein